MTQNKIASFVLEIWFEIASRPQEICLSMQMSGTNVL